MWTHHGDQSGMTPGWSQLRPQGFQSLFPSSWDLVGSVLKCRELERSRGKDELPFISNRTQGKSIAEHIQCSRTFLLWSQGSVSIHIPVPGVSPLQFGQPHSQFPTITHFEMTLYLLPRYSLLPKPQPEPSRDTASLPITKITA